MRIIVMGVLTLALSGCAPSVRDVDLSGLDLADGKTLASLQDALPQDDRAALGTYALLHWPKSRFYCGEPIEGRSSIAATVGEAIAQTRAYERRLALARARTDAPVAQTSRNEEIDLVNRMERLVLERDMLRSRMGPAAETAPEGITINRNLATIRTELAALRDRSAT